MKVLITCPPMLGVIDEFRNNFSDAGVDILLPDVIQTLSESELIKLIPSVDGWIIGDDPVTKKVLEAGKNGHLKAAVKWGIGIDNVDLAAAGDLKIPIRNTPDMFGAEVADIAMGYLIGLSRETYRIDREVRAGKWPKPCGISLLDKVVGLVGYGDIGKNCANRMRASGVNLQIYDPAYTNESDSEHQKYVQWPLEIDKCDFLVFTCSLNKSNRHMLNNDVLDKCKDGVRVINVARGGLIDEFSLEEKLISGKVHSAALDVMEEEPLPSESRLRNFDKVIFGSHNASNTIEAVRRTSQKAIAHLFEMLGVPEGGN